MKYYQSKINALERMYFVRCKRAAGLPIVINSVNGGFVVNGGIKRFNSLEEVKKKYQNNLIIIDDISFA